MVVFLVGWSLLQSFERIARNQRRMYNIIMIHFNETPHSSTEESESPVEKPKAENKSIPTKELDFIQIEKRKIKIARDLYHRKEAANADLLVTRQERALQYQETGLTERGRKEAEKVFQQAADRSTPQRDFYTFDEFDWDKVGEAVDAIFFEVFEQKDWPAQHLAAEDIQGKTKMEFIVHPLYTVLFVPKGDGSSGGLWNEELWIECGENVEKYVTACLQDLSQKACKELRDNPDKTPASYLQIMEIIQEWDAMHTPSAIDVRRVYIMPHRSMLSQERREAMDSLLTHLQQTTQFSVMDSRNDTVGNIPPQELQPLRGAMADVQEIEIQGGYLNNACIDGCFRSLIDTVTHSEQTVTIDFDPSSEKPNAILNIAAESELPTIQLPSFVKNMDSEALSVAALSMSIQDCKKWLQENAEFQEAFRNVHLDRHNERIQELQKYFMEKNEKNRVPSMKVSVWPSSVNGDVVA
jgi:hypothetical protein